MRIAVMLLALWASSYAATATPDTSSPLARLFGGPSPRQALQGRLARLDSGRAVKVPGATVSRDKDLSAFYAARQGAPAWFSNGRPSRAAWQLLDAVRKSELEGLDPDEYHAVPLDSLLRRSQRGGFWRLRGDPQAVANIDLLLSDAAFKLARHLLYGRVRLKMPIPVDNWHVGEEHVDLTAWLTDALAGKRDFRNALLELEPIDPGYGVMKYWLSEYRRIEEAGGWPKVPDGPALGPGSTGSRVAALCHRLAADGAWREGECGESWTTELGEAVRRFQESHGLEATGVAASQTLKQLNVPIEDRIDQIELNLECWRWLPRELGTRHVRVNIADYSLGAWRNGAEEFSMRVVVGRKEDSTPVFSDTIKAIQLNPSWNVPPTIAREEILPELQRDAGYLASHDMELLAGWGEKAQVVRADSIDWQSIDSSKFVFRIRQKNGDASALGRLKFVLANPFNIYLHDTPSKGYFQRNKRALSHGCVRLSEPIRLAEWVLRDDPKAGKEWTPEKLAAGIAQGDEKFVPLSEGVPVHILYWTCFPDKEGGLQFRQDVYGWNRRMELALARKAATF
jgi:murein L,D-transpeptidase YcbB/YkuD